MVKDVLSENQGLWLEGDDMESKTYIVIFALVTSAQAVGCSGGAMFFQ